MIRVNFLQRHRTLLVPDQRRPPPQPFQPRHHLLRIGHAAAQEQQLRARRRQGQRQLVIQAPVRVAQHLVFVHHQQRRAVAADQPVLLRLQRRHDDRRG